MIRSPDCPAILTKLKTIIKENTKIKLQELIYVRVDFIKVFHYKRAVVKL